LRFISFFSGDVNQAEILLTGTRCNRQITAAATHIAARANAGIHAQFMIGFDTCRRITRRFGLLPV